MATFASVAGVQLPANDREGQPIIFDSYDMTPVLFGSGKCARNLMNHPTSQRPAPSGMFQIVDQ